jgi:hypothetical protein
LNIRANREASMAEVHFTAWLRELAPDGPVQASGGTVGEALAAVFTERPHLRGYVLDERGRLRKHVCVFADGARLANSAALAHAIPQHARLHVMQALSGG